MEKILNKFQKDFLKTLGKTELSKFFIWSGGTVRNKEKVRKIKKFFKEEAKNFLRKKLK